ncbi:MAG TPA: peptidase C1 [Hyphomonadaceae bacterium]|nr:peptidase C1 [Hyphomonadaceae bacterium]
MTELVVRKDLRAELGPVRDQGRRPTCLAFAASACHEHAQALQAPFSAEWLYYHAVKREGGQPEDGCAPSDVCLVVAEDGQPFETAWPYHTHVEAPWTPATDVGELFRADEVPCAFAFEEVAREVESDRPIVLGLYIGQTFRAPAVIGGEARVVDDSDDIDPESGHAVLAVGTGVLDGDDVILVRNSWGARWGVGGHAWLSRDYLERRALAAFGFKARN